MTRTGARRDIKKANSFPAVFVSLLATMWTCGVHSSGINDVSPSPANWQQVTYYPPVSLMPILSDFSLNVDITTTIPLVSVVAPFCHSYPVAEPLTPPTGQSLQFGDAQLFEVFCRTTFPRSLTDQPLRPQDVIATVTNSTTGANTQTAPFTFAWFQGCYNGPGTYQSPDTWFTMSSTTLHSDTPGNTSFAFPPSAYPICQTSTMCYYTTNGLPIPPGYAAQPGGVINAGVPYYCCTQTTSPANSATSFTNTTTCVYYPNNDPSGGTAQPTACPRSVVHEICTVSQILSASGIVTNTSSYVCNYNCSFPCVTTPASTTGECFGSDASGMTDCLPSAHFNVCSRSALSSIPPYCPNGEQAYGFLPNATPLFNGTRPRCATGTVNCVIECHCYQPQGCPEHPTCNFHGTYYETETLASTAPAQCKCDPGYFGKFCQFASPDIQCNNGHPLYASHAPVIP